MSEFAVELAIPNDADAKAAMLVAFLVLRKPNEADGPPETDDERSRLVSSTIRHKLQSVLPQYYVDHATIDSLVSLPDGIHVDMNHLKSGEVNLGTSIMAINFRDGVILGADSRTTTGAYIANRVTDKLTQVHDTIWCCRSGSAADTQAVADIVQYQLGLFSMHSGKPPMTQTAASIFQETSNPITMKTASRSNNPRSFFLRCQTGSLFLSQLRKKCPVEYSRSFAAGTCGHLWPPLPFVLPHRKRSN